MQYLKRTQRHHVIQNNIDNIHEIDFVIKETERYLLYLLYFKFGVSMSTDYYR